MTVPGLSKTQNRESDLNQVRRRLYIKIDALLIYKSNKVG